jgi:hypothetical protein
MLSVIKHIKTYGIEETLIKFNLKSKIYDKKILLKYDQIESPMGLSEVQDCRGLILEKGTWNIMCFSFRKFFNADEGHASSIDWNTARVLEKCDGSMIQLYWDWNKNEWFASTTGMAEGEGEVNNKLGTRFNGLFWNTVHDKYGFNDCLLDKNHVYVFELMTPYNIVVTPHGESKVALLTVRNIKTLKEVTWSELSMISKSIGVPIVNSIDMNSYDVDSLKKTFDGMPFTEEGYVVVDDNFNRIKIKNPAYVAAHHLKSKTSEHAIIDIIKSNEVDEFSATFPDRKDEIIKLRDGYNLLLSRLDGAWYGQMESRRPKNITPKERKRYAMEVFEVVELNGFEPFKSMFFLLNDGKVGSPKEYLMKYDNKKLYNLV